MVLVRINRDKMGKIILVDAVDAFVIRDGDSFKIFEEMHTLLETFPNRKIILTGANDEQFKKFGLDKMPYEVFTLKHNPEKTDPEYYKVMLKHFNLSKDDVVYFEHNPDAVKSAESVGIKTYYYDFNKADLSALKEFLATNLNNNFIGVIIEESLEDKSVLKELKITKTEVEQVTSEHKTPWIKQWTLHTVEIPESKAGAIAEILSRSLDSKHNWYADFKNDTNHYIIFRDKVFYIDRTSKKQYDGATAYGLKLGIPDYQLDFSPHIKEWKR